MSEPMRIICMLFGGPCYTIDDGRRVWKFEMHPQMGPCVVHKTTEEPIKDPDQRSPYWTAIEAWIKHGKQVTEDGVCIWRKP